MLLCEVDILHEEQLVEYMTLLYISTQGKMLILYLQVNFTV
ncbi:hypothetical protein BTN50_1151 [Candidatus Enterovibrio altilux]|uniref:Uncharacterized protein n=1 Tax=Candidatus Enterovibrio altilux TaxID=1927128 RepID=A0A291B9H1_9GAMM|nr:hypothetical protein BTN50_1151 [Candidatus Enterovibrio luxaltus]